MPNNDNNISAISSSIDIETKSTINALNRLIKSVTTLNEAANNTGGMKSLVSSMRSISRINFENIKGLTEVRKTIQSIAKIGGQAPMLPNLAKLTGQSSEAQKVLKSNQTEIALTKKELQMFGEEFETTQTKFGEMVDSFKRIAWYRTVRRIINLVSQAMQDGLRDYARYDAATNTTMSNLMNVTNKTRSTLGITMSSIMQTLEPAIVGILNGVTSITNTFNAMFAAMRGESQYTKVIQGAKDYRAEVEKTNKALASFDKFEVLSGDSIPRYETAGVTEQLAAMGGLGEMFVSLGELSKGLFGGLKETVEALLPAIIGIADAFIPVVSVLSDTVGWIVEMLDKTNLLVPAITALAGAWVIANAKERSREFQEFTYAITAQTAKVYESKQAWEQSQVQTSLARQELQFLKDNTNGVTVAMVEQAEQNLRVASSQEHLAKKTYETAMAQEKQLKTAQLQKTAFTALQAIAGAAGLGASLGDLINNWNELSTAERISRISTIALTAAYTGLAIAQLMARVAAGGTVGWIAGIGAATAIVATIASAVAQVGAFAQGGIPQTGSMFIAGEAGAEWVGNINGKTGVMNQNQVGDMLTEMRQAAYDGVFNAIQDSGGIGDGSNYNAIPVSASGLYQLVKVESSRRGNIKIINNKGYLN